MRLCSCCCFVPAALAPHDSACLQVVVIAALDGDFRRKPFGRVLELVPMAEKIDKVRLVWGEGGLRVNRGALSQAESLLRTRALHAVLRGLYACKVACCHLAAGSAFAHKPR